MPRKKKPQVTVTPFEELFAQMAPKMPKCKPISLKRYRAASDEEQRGCYLWLKAIQTGPFARLCRILRDLSDEQWELRLKLYPDLDECMLRRRYEKELKLVWDMTLPEVLVKKKSENSPQSSASSET